MSCLEDIAHFCLQHGQAPLANLLTAESDDVACRAAIALAGAQAVPILVQTAGGPSGLYALMGPTLAEDARTTLLAALAKKAGVEALVDRSTDRCQAAIALLKARVPNAVEELVAIERKWGSSLASQREIDELRRTNERLQSEVARMAQMYMTLMEKNSKAPRAPKAKPKGEPAAKRAKKDPPPKKDDDDQNTQAFFIP